MVHVKGNLRTATPIGHSLRDIEALAKWFNSVFTAIVKRNINDGIVGQSDNNVFIELLGSWHTDEEWLEYQLRSMSWERYQPAFLIVIRLSGVSAKLNDSCSRDTGTS